MYTITKADPSNQNFVGKSIGDKQTILNSRNKVEFICFSQGDTGFVRGFYLDPSAKQREIDFEPLDYFQDAVGFTSMFYKLVAENWTEL